MFQTAVTTHRVHIIARGRSCPEFDSREKTRNDWTVVRTGGFFFRSTTHSCSHQLLRPFLVRGGKKFSTTPTRSHYIIIIDLMLKAFHRTP